MLTEPLLNTLDVRKKAVRGVTVSGALKPLDLPRFRTLLADDTGAIQAVLMLDRDEENRCLIGTQIDAQVTVVCQRCLEPMPTTLHTENTVVVVWTDEQAQHLPKHLDALIVAEEACNLWELVEDELILSMPIYSYHEAEDCNKILSGLSAEAPAIEGAEDKPNPFNVLAQLKPGNKH